MQSEVVPGVAWSEAVAALGRALSAMQPNEGSVLLSCKGDLGGCGWASGAK